MMNRPWIITAFLLSVALMNAPRLVNNVLAQQIKPKLGTLSQQKEPKEPQFVEGEMLLKINEAILPKNATFKKGKSFSTTDEPEEKLRARKYLRNVLQDRRVALLEKGNKFAKKYKLRILAIYPMTGILRIKASSDAQVVPLIKQIKIENPNIVDYAVRNSKGYLLSHNTPSPPHPNDQYWNLHTQPWLPDGPVIPFLWGHEKIGLREAWTDTRGGNIVVAIIDSGLDTTHPDLHSNLWVNTEEAAGTLLGDDDGNCYTNDINGANMLAFNWECLEAMAPELGPDPADPAEFCMYPQTQGNISDGNGHGTYMAGIIGALPNNQIPDVEDTPAIESDQTASVGVNWTVKLMGIKSWCIAPGNTDQGEPDMNTDLGSNIRAVEYAIEMGAHIINASWIWPVGTDLSEMQPLSNAIQLAKYAGILFVTGAGNNHSNNASVPRYPASFTLDNLITVAATGFNASVEDGDPVDKCIDFDDEKSDCLYFNSNYSTTGSVHIAAPGWFIVGTNPPSLPLTPVGGNCVPSPCHPPDDLYMALSNGTSAAAYVSGCAALLQGMRNNLSLPLLSPLDLKTLLITSGDQPRDSANKLLLAGKTLDARRLNCHEALHRMPVCLTCMGTAGSPPEDAGVSP